MRRLQQVFALPRDGLARRFPSTVLAHLDVLLRALQASPLPVRAAGPFPYPHRVRVQLESSQALLFPATLTSDLATFLACCDGGVQRFTTVFELMSVIRPARSTSGFCRQNAMPVLLFELARNRLDRLRLPAPTRACSCRRTSAATVRCRRHATCSTPVHNKPCWEQLRGTCVPAWGDSAVRPVVLHADHRPGVQRAAHRQTAKDPATAARRQSGCCTTHPPAWPCGCRGST